MFQIQSKIWLRAAQQWLDYWDCRFRPCLLYNYRTITTVNVGHHYHCTWVLSSEFLDSKESMYIKMYSAVFLPLFKIVGSWGVAWCNCNYYTSTINCLESWEALNVFKLIYILHFNWDGSYKNCAVVLCNNNIIE